MDGEKTWYFCQICGDINEGICENPECEMSKE